MKITNSIDDRKRATLRPKFRVTLEHLASVVIEDVNFDSWESNRTSSSCDLNDMVAYAKASRFTKTHVEELINDELWNRGMSWLENSSPKYTKSAWRYIELKLLKMYPEFA